MEFHGNICEHSDLILSTQFWSHTLESINFFQGYILFLVLFVNSVVITA